jgi:hypothetical protein
VHARQQANALEARLLIEQSARGIVLPSRIAAHRSRSERQSGCRRFATPFEQDEHPCSSIPVREFG